MVDKKELEELLCKAINLFREKNSLAKDCVLTLLYNKYSSDIYSERVKNIQEEYSGDQRAIDGKISRIVLKMTKEGLFSYFYLNKNNPKIKEIVKNGLSAFKNNRTNDAWLSSVITTVNMDFIVDNYLETIDKNLLVSLIDLFGGVDLSGKEDYDLFGTACEILHGWKYSFQSFREYIGL